MVWLCHTCLRYYTDRLQLEHWDQPGSSLISMFQAQNQAWLSLNYGTVCLFIWEVLNHCQSLLNTHYLHSWGWHIFKPFRLFLLSYTNKLDHDLLIFALHLKSPHLEVGGVGEQLYIQLPCGGANIRSHTDSIWLLFLIDTLQTTRLRFGL